MTKLFMFILKFTLRLKVYSTENAPHDVENLNYSKLTYMLNNSNANANFFSRIELSILTFIKVSHP